MATASRTVLIVNADDLGFSVGVTDGILDCHRRGILSSTTLMTTMPDRDRAIDLVGQAPALGVGIHLCLTQGTPLTACRRILDAAGEFPRSLPKLALRLLSESAVAQAEAEWDAQVQYALQRGLRPTHLDSHKHVHHIPWLQRAVVNVARRFAIPYVRAAREIAVPGTPRPSLRGRILTRFARSLAGRLARHHLASSDHFFGLAATDGMSADIWQLLLDHLPTGVTEVMVHPGYPAGLTRHETHLIESRQRDLDALLDPAVRRVIEQRNIVLAHYGNLAALTGRQTI